MTASLPMNTSRLRRLMAMAIAVLFLCPGGAGAGSADRPFASLATGPVSGIYYPVGQAICNAVNATRTGLAPSTMWIPWYRARTSSLSCNLTRSSLR